MASGSFVSSTGTALNLYVKWSSVKDVANNQSKVTMIAYLRYVTINVGSRTDSYLKCGDDTYTYTSQSIKDYTDGSKEVEIGRTTFTVTHDSEGKKSVTLKAGWRFSGTYSDKSITWITCSKTVTLDTIERASVPTLSATSIAMGGSVTITTNRKNSTFTHTISYEFEDATGTIASSVGASTKWTPSLDLASEIPSATSGKCKIICKTYNGTTLLGTNSVELTLTVPTSVKPSISTFEVSPSNSNSVVNGWGIYLQGYSKASIAFTAAGARGSTISSYKIEYSNSVIESASGTTALLSTSGNLKITVTATDTRGRTASSSKTIYIYPYSKPALNSISCYRANASGSAASNGTYIYVKATQVYSSCNGNNSCAIKVRYKTPTGSYGSYTTLASSTGQVVGGGEIALKSSYIVQFVVTDALDKYEIDLSIPTEAVTLHLKDGGLGVGIGKYAEEDNLLDVDLNAKFRHEVGIDTTNNPTLTFYMGGKPVGSIGSYSSGGVFGDMFIRVYNSDGNYKEYTWAAS